MNADMQKINAKLEVLKKAYSQKIKSHIEDLKTFLAEGFQPEDIYSIIHSISGTSGMFGMSEVSALATDFEFFLKELKNKPKGTDQNILNEKLEKFIRDLELLGL